MGLPRQWLFDGSQQEEEKKENVLNQNSFSIVATSLSLSSSDVSSPSSSSMMAIIEEDVPNSLIQRWQIIAQGVQAEKKRLRGSQSNDEVSSPSSSHSIDSVVQLAAATRWLCQHGRIHGLSTVCSLLKLWRGMPRSWRLSVLRGLAESLVDAALHPSDDVDGKEWGDVRHIIVLLDAHRGGLLGRGLHVWRLVRRHCDSTVERFSVDEAARILVHLPVPRVVYRGACILQPSLRSKLLGVVSAGCATTNVADLVALLLLRLDALSRWHAPTARCVLRRELESTVAAISSSLQQPDTNCVASAHRAMALLLLMSLEHLPRHSATKDLVRLFQDSCRTTAQLHHELPSKLVRRVRCALRLAGYDAAADAAAAVAVNCALARARDAHDGLNQLRALCSTLQSAKSAGDGDEVRHSRSRAVRDLVRGLEAWQGPIPRSLAVAALECLARYSEVRSSRLRRRLKLAARKNK
eukprot:PhM_4_TR12941/c0_g1_i1/m.5657